MTRHASHSGDRIAKVLARRGVASRRAAEAMIAAGRVAVNGRVIDTPALTVAPSDRIEVDGRPVPEPEPPRLWLYHKPVGLVTTERDEKGRPTVFAALPPGMGRVVSVGRLDLNSEGLLLLTNDGEIKRRLELPSTGWLRKYRVRVNGTPTEAALDPLRRGITLGEEHFQPMEVTLDRQQGANAWLTVGIREGRNREVRRALEAVGLTVNRLIRISYGPFRLGALRPGEVEEVRPKVLRDQLGLGLHGRAPAGTAKKGAGGKRAAGAAPRGGDETPTGAPKGKGRATGGGRRRQAADGPARGPAGGQRGRGAPARPTA
ncbi:MAG: rRNA pseudouridine synthase, partial [Rhodobacteraceae bacterium]|nr:rRNA pseudouridine synthase [Paracoccaceae bacterium]